ncbi:hypothetical protein [Roseibacillus persicicus]|uniref:Glycosyl transferase family 1 domain-containing protein n=1 Tax=Roseibacillus persicicus TaxID=454148 RepID=A0A918TIG1_9BACT|nr:hypothetical protein [Roseibacillus persicicus]GHC43636.1 hypothetical protein GCM10007100_06000 [Roseibacillus persicicus]
MNANDPTPKTVVLADPRWDGHHPTYFFEFTASLLRLGHRVMGLCREPGEFESEVRQICKRMDLDFDTRVIVGQLDDPDKAYFRPGQDHDPVSTVVRWNCLKKAIDTASKASGAKVDFVFLPWLDSYLRFQPSTKLANKLGVPWSGLYFRNHHFGGTLSSVRKAAKGDRSLRNPNCVAVGILDERFSEAMAHETGKKIIAFPDITNENPPEVPSPFALEVIKQAAGRKIIGMVSLEKRKGFLTMLKIAEAVAGREDWFFVAAGKYAKETCSEEEQAYCTAIQAKVDSGELNNLYLQLPGERVNDGADFNSLIKVFDVIYAAYEDFEGSSNALTKGAIFERPLIATKGECVGGRVEEFGMGLTIEQGSVAEGEQAIRKVLAGEDWEGKELKKRYADYHALHDRKRLDEVFAELLELGAKKSVAVGE